MVRDGIPEPGAAGENELERNLSASPSFLFFLKKRKRIPPTIHANATSPIVRPTAAPVPSFPPPPLPSSADFLFVSTGATGVGITVIMRSSPDSVTVDA